MLDRELLIGALMNKLGAGMTPSGSEITDLRRQLRGLSLSDLAARYRVETGNDPYELKKEEA